MIRIYRTPTIFAVPVITLVFFLARPQPCQAGPKIEPPKKIEYEGTLLSYNPSWKDEEAYLETNLDEDPEPEVVISFVAMYVTESKKTREDPKPFTIIAEKELLPVYNYVFYQIYDLGPDKNYKLTRTFTGMDRPGQVYVMPLEKEKPPAVIFVSPGGTHYKDIVAYRWQEGGYRQIFEHGTSADVTVVTTPGKAEIILGKDVYVWKAEKGRFELKFAQTQPETKS